MNPVVVENSTILGAGISSKLDYVLSNVVGDERPYLRVSIFNKEFLGLLDSGASRTVLGSKGYEQLKSLNLELIPSTVKSCGVANGEQCQVIGSYNIPFCVRDKIQVINVLIIPSLPHLLILGSDFWRKMGIVPDLRHGLWHFTDADPLEHQVLAITDSTHLTPEQSIALDNFIENIFSKIPDGLGCTDMVSHVIRSTAEPIKQRFYPISPALQKHVNDELDDMLQRGVVEPSSSPWASPIVMVKKKDGSYRFCVDYRKVNSVTQRDAYPLPQVTNTLDKLRDARYLSSLDIKSAYWQVPMDESSKPMTAFTVPGRGLYQFCRMPFGLHNAPATWQRLIDRVLGLDLEPYVFVYLDDIIIVTQTFDKHLEVMKEVFERLTKAGLTVGRDKCKFCRPELKYLGYVVNSSGLHVDPEKVSAILNIRPPKNVSEVRRILGITSWYRRFIPNFATIVAPITNLLRKHVKFVWSEECNLAFERVKEHLVSAPIISCPDFDKPFSIQTDASDFGLGAVLSQSHEDGERVVSFISRSLTSSERKYSVTEKECLAVLWAIERFRPYVEATHFTVITDHFALKWLHSLKDPSGRLARWSVRLQQYDFDVIHRKGKDHIVPDVLSRSVPVVDEISINSLTFEGYVDPWYDKMSRKITDNPLHYPQWRVENGVILKKIRSAYPSLDDSAFDWKVVVPKSHRTEIIRNHHDPPTSGHAGVYKTYDRVGRKFYWPKMRSDIANYIRSCRVCLATKPVQKPPSGLMCSRTDVSRPWELISLDIVGPLPRSSNGYKYILSIQDYFTKFCLFLPMREATASGITRLIEEHVFLLFGVPRTLITDNGKQFISKEFSKLMNAYKVKHFRTANYHPQADPCEAQHRTLKTMLASYVKDNHRSWDTLLQKVACAMRTGISETTGMSPYFVNFGREIVLSGPDHTPPKVSDDPQLTSALRPEQRPDVLTKIFQDVRARIIKAQMRSAKNYNLRRRDERYSVGQRVWRKSYVLSDKINYVTAKLAPRYVGPLVVSKVVSPWTYELKELNGNNAGVWHAKDLKKDPD